MYMAMEATSAISINLSFLRDYLALRRRRDEHLLRFWMSRSVERAAIQRDLDSFNTRLLGLECTLSKAGLQLVLPCEKETEELDARLINTPPEELSAVVAQREGELFDLLRTRLRLLRMQFDPLDAVAKINLLLRRLGYSRCTSLIGALRLGQVPESVDLSAFSPADASWITRLFQRLGFPVSLEGGRLQSNRTFVSDAAVAHGSQKIWLAAEQAARFSQNAEALNRISPKIQLCNAERQVKTYTPEEDQYFEELQGQYLALLKERDEILQTFYEEEKMFV